MDWFDFDTTIKGLMSFTAFLLVTGVFYLFGWWLWRRLRVRREREHALNIHHQANFRGFYYLAVESPDPNLRFCFLAGNKALAEVSRPAVTAPAGKKANAPATASAKTAQKQPAPVAGGAAPAAVNGVVDGGKQAMVKVGVFANLMGIVAGFLPGSMGKKLKEQQEQVKKAQQKAVTTAQAPQDAQRRLDALQKESQKLGVKAPDANLSAASAPQSQGQSLSNGTQAQPALASQGEPLNPAQSPFDGLYCVQTVDVEPGQTLPIKLHIDALARRRPVGSFAYTIHLQAIPAEPLQEKIPQISKRGTAYFAPVAVWRAWMPGFSILLVFLLGLMSWLYLAAMIWK